MLNGQDLLSWIAAVGGVGGIVAAIFAFLAYWSRHDVPYILPELDDQPKKGGFIVIRQSDEKDWWLICSVRLARTRREWLAETGPTYRKRLDATRSSNLWD